MNIEVIKMVKMDKGFFKGFATVRLTSGDSSLIINGFTIKETKAGKLIGVPPQQKNEKDGKWYDLVKLEGNFMWEVSNVIIDAYEGRVEIVTQKSEETSPGASKVDMMKKEGLDKTINKVGRFNPWEE